VDNDLNYRVLLVGIDAYTVKPLFGCVNDIDAVQRLLLEQAGIPRENITRLASPHPDAQHDTTIAQKPATLANIRAELARLASEEVEPKDRVFVYYSGHGGLVPVDFKATRGRPQLFLDFEFNRILAAIAKRTSSVTVVLDCCHSTGATRDLTDESEIEMTARVMEFSSDSPPVQIEADQARAIAVESGLGSVDDCQVVAACLNHELAKEGLGADGVKHGLLSRAFLALLGQVDKSEIRSVPWARVWQRMRESVETANPAQHLWMSGNYARAVLAGPPVEGDAGFAIKKTGPNEYAIDAGTLADVGEGAKLAVYKDKPLFFPAFGSREDEAARVNKSLLQVVRAEKASAVARCESDPFDLPAGARARLVELGPEAKLRCAVVPENAGVVAALKASDLLQVVEERAAQALLKQRKDGTWELGDDVAGAKPSYPALIALRPDQLAFAREILELYNLYSLPLRMATRCTDLPGQLNVRLLACKDKVPEDQAQKADLPEATKHEALNYNLEIGMGFCVHVHNGSNQRLRVALVNCAASGRVEFLGDQIIDPHSYYRFWMNNDQGKPFVATPAGGKSSYIDRMVAIGTTLLNKDLSYLHNDTRFSEILAPTREVAEEPREINTPERPVEQWTATQVLLGVGIPDTP